MVFNIQHRLALAALNPLINSTEAELLDAAGALAQATLHPRINSTEAELLAACDTLAAAINQLDRRVVADVMICPQTREVRVQTMHIGNSGQLRDIGYIEMHFNRLAFSHTQASADQSVHALLTSAITALPGWTALVGSTRRSGSSAAGFLRVDPPTGNSGRALGSTVLVSPLGSPLFGWDV